MAYDPQPAARVLEMFAEHLAVREQAMFGALAFVDADRVAVPASTEGGPAVRVDAARAEQLSKTTAAWPLTMRGRTMQGWVHIHREHVRSWCRLSEWITVGTEAATSALGATP